MEAELEIRINANGQNKKEVYLVFWIWSVPEDYPNNRIGEYIEGSGTDRFLFREGKKLLKEEVVSPKIIFECDEKYLYDVLPNNGFLLIVSEKVIEILNENCPDDIQIFEASVYAKNGRVPNYFLLNVLNSIEVLDKVESKYTTIRGTDAILSLDKIVYKGNLEHHYHILRNKDYKSHVLVSDSIKTAFEKKRVKGVQFE
ncbi:imm11 family protein [Sutcliffiella horikoshii]|uniref:imm11 family protein n=1 Tax=Sutcliffiella horikoshii TaxID=79883 RepID=UPI001F48B0E7|nr:DUF1629 domain-containing protein [Sutcliffiella horikoshii]MCG1021467.1 hypothetical protein [Sutcliffiella horikoshii]